MAMLCSQLTCSAVITAGDEVEVAAVDGRVKTFSAGHAVGVALTTTTAENQDVIVALH